MKWLGTKGGSGVWQRICAEMPVHVRYVEPFCGAATIARLKFPSAETWLVDADPAAPGLADDDARRRRSSSATVKVFVGDARFQGDNFRERERIKRKAARWQRMFLAMRHGERAAVLAKLNEVAP
jgi:DNA adenine methylase